MVKTDANRGFLNAVERDAENVRLAFNRAIDQADWPALEKLLNPAMAFYDIRGHYLEADAILCRAVQKLKAESDPTNVEHQKLLARYLERQARCFWGLSAYAQGVALLYESLTLMRRFPPGIEAINALHQLSFTVDDLDEGLRLGEEALEIAQALNLKEQIANLVANLGTITTFRGDYPRARRLFEEAFKLSQRLNTRSKSAFALGYLSLACLWDGDHAKARQYAREALAAAEAIGLWMVRWYAWFRLGTIARAEENYEEARQSYQMSVDIVTTGNYRQGFVFALGGLGSAACALEDYPEAQRRICEAVSIAKAIQNPSAQLHALESAAELLAKIGQIERAVELASLVANHPFSRPDSRHHAAFLLARLERTLPAPAFQDAWHHGMELKIRTEEADVLSLLRQPLPTPLTPSPSRGNLSANFSARELEVLRLLAGGLPNREIAAQLVLAPTTVKWYVSEILSKLGVANRTQAGLRARELGLLG